jgi:hypothetical protein
MMLKRGFTAIAIAARRGREGRSIRGACRLFSDHARPS